MDSYKIFAIRAGSEDVPADVLFQSLQKGEGRFGWSYTESADLNRLKVRIENEGWESLNNNEQDCWQPFLLDLEAGDYVVYVNMPEWGKCTIAKVSGPYFWRWEDDDFNHRFPVDRESVRAFDTNDAAVPPYLRARLKLPPRKWQIYAQSEFEQLLGNLFADTMGQATYSGETDRIHLARDLEPHLISITQTIQRTHPNYALEGLLAEVLKHVPNIVDVTLQGGAGDHGADIIFTYEEGLPFANLKSQKKCVVQVKSYEGELGDTTAVNDIRRAFAYYKDADIGLIISTADSSSKTFDQELEKLCLESGKQVGLLVGKDVARFALQYGLKLIRS